MTTKYIKIVLNIIFVLFMISCGKEDSTGTDTDGKIFPINENIDTIVYKEHGTSLMDIHCASITSDNRLFISHPLRFYDLNEELEVLKYENVSNEGAGYYNESNDNKSNSLYVDTKEYAFSIGALKEINSNNNIITTLLDESHNISSAVYYHDTNNIIYYSYGKPYGENPGYYMYDRITGESNLIFEYISEAGISEFINGFDIHPEKNILLIPVVKGEFESPFIVEYNFNTDTLDTLNVGFDLSFNRSCLWLRYNKSGNKILYSCYPQWAGTAVTNDDSEVGIIERETLTKTILDVNTNEETGRSVNICPQWSNDDEYIIFASAPLAMPEGNVGLYHIYKLKF